jgi:hypothetical protein
LRVPIYLFFTPSGGRWNVTLGRGRNTRKRQSARTRRGLREPQGLRQDRLPHTRRTRRASAGAAGAPARGTEPLRGVPRYASRGRKFMAFQTVPLPWWEGKGEGDSYESWEFIYGTSHQVPSFHYSIIALFHCSNVPMAQRPVLRSRLATEGKSEAVFCYGPGDELTGSTVNSLRLSGSSSKTIIKGTEACGLMLTFASPFPALFRNP